MDNTGCNNMDPSGSVLVRRGKGVLGSGKLQHHQPLSRVADMTPVNGRIELRPRKGEGGRTLPPGGRTTNLGSVRF